MAGEYTVTCRRYTEQVVEGRRLGRHAAFDSRSLLYPFRPPPMAGLTSVDWARHIPILDQGGLGSCEGNAEAGCAGTSPVWDALPAPWRRGGALDEEEAVALYSAATVLDSFAGSYPPDDTGTDSTSVSKAARNAGLISGFTWAAALADLLAALQAGPVNFAFDWYDSFDSPSSSGLVSISRNAGIRGGHALCARGVDAARRYIWLDNSWGTSWGVDGRFCMTYATAERLLAQQGEAVVPVPLTDPAPQPVPTDSFASAWAAGQPGGIQAWCRGTRTRQDLVVLKGQLQDVASSEGLPL